MYSLCKFLLGQCSPFVYIYNLFIKQALLKLIDNFRDDSQDGGRRPDYGANRRDS